MELERGVSIIDSFKKDGWIGVYVAFDLERRHCIVG